MRLSPLWVLICSTELPFFDRKTGWAWHIETLISLGIKTLMHAESPGEQHVIKTESHFLTSLVSSFLTSWLLWFQPFSWTKGYGSSQRKLHCNNSMCFGSDDLCVLHVVLCYFTFLEFLLNKGFNNYVNLISYLYEVI